MKIIVKEHYIHTWYQVSQIWLDIPFGSVNDSNAYSALLTLTKYCFVRQKPFPVMIAYVVWKKKKVFLTAWFPSHRRIAEDAKVKTSIVGYTYNMIMTMP